MELFCATCNIKLTSKPLIEVSIAEINTTDGEELLGAGDYILADKLDFILHKDITFLISKSSVNVKHHSDTKRLHGCCGPGDLEQMSQVCSNCSSEIGTISSDCWMPHFIGVSEKAISLKPIW